MRGFNTGKLELVITEIIIFLRACVYNARALPMYLMLFCNKYKYLLTLVPQACHNRSIEKKKTSQLIHK